MYHIFKSLYTVWIKNPANNLTHFGFFYWWKSPVEEKFTDCQFCPWKHSYTHEKGHVFHMISKRCLTCTTFSLSLVCNWKSCPTGPSQTAEFQVVVSHQFDVETSFSCFEFLTIISGADTRLGAIRNGFQLDSDSCSFPAMPFIDAKRQEYLFYSDFL